MRILLVCDAIAPLQGIASIRWTKLSKYLKKEHETEVTVDVLTVRKNYDNPNGPMRIFPKDSLLEMDMKYFDNYYDVEVVNGLRLANYYKMHVIGQNNHFFTAEDAIKHGCKSRIKARLRAFYETYYSLIVRRSLYDAIRYKVDCYDVIISTYNPIWPTMLCYKLKLINPKLIWIADFRDTCGRDNIDMAGYAPWHRKYTLSRTKYANAVLHVDDFIETYTSAGVPDYTITNGFDPDEASEPVKSDTFDLVYTGSIYGNQQDFGIVFKALQELAVAGDLNPNDVRVVYAGRYGEQANRIASTSNTSITFHNLGEIPRASARALQQQASILIQAAFNTADDHCAWTGKMYEYMLAKRPIAYIVNGSVPNSFPSLYMRRLGGVCYEASNHEATYPELVRYIRDKYCEWAATGHTAVDCDESYVEQYSYKTIAEKLWQVLQAL